MDLICQGQNGAIKWKLMKVSEVPFKRVIVSFSHVIGSETYSVTIL